jgi:hypothetical protein
MKTRQKTKGSPKIIMNRLSNPKVLVAAAMALVITLSLSTFAAGGKHKKNKKKPKATAASVIQERPQPTGALVLHVMTYQDDPSEPGQPVVTPNEAGNDATTLADVSFNMTCSQVQYKIKKENGKKKSKAKSVRIINNQSFKTDDAGSIFIRQFHTGTYTKKKGKGWVGKADCSISNVQKAGSVYNGATLARGEGLGSFTVVPKDVQPQYPADGDATSVRIEFK